MKSIAEAPGKVIITGEHFVVHGAHALAAAIGKKVKVEAERAEELSIQSDRFPTHGSEVPSALLPVRKLVRDLYRDRGKEARVRLKVTSQVLEGSGLGSSASTMVATVAALSRLEDWQLDIASVMDWAMIGEKEVHGRPSGVDVKVTALGGLIMFKMGREPKVIRVDRPITILVAYSGRKRRTGKLIAKVSGMKNTHPYLLSRLSESVSLLTELAAKNVEKGELQELGKLLTLNHALLGRVGASNTRLDELVELCLSVGCYGAKLTGAGGGGSVIAILPRGKERSALKEIQGKGYPHSFLTTIPCEGVRSWVAK